MSIVPRVSLGELCTIQIGRTPPRDEPRYWGRGHPWLSIADMSQGRNLFSTKETITEAAVNERNCRLVSIGTVVLSFKLTIGKVGLVRREMFTNEAIAALPIRDVTRLDAGYLLHALMALDFRNLGERAVKGITLNAGSVAQLKIPVPPLSEQQQIAAILDKADSVQRKQQERMRLLDEFLRSAFLEMFGDPVRNEKGWELLRLADCLLEKPVIGTITPATEPGEFSVIRVGELGEYDVAIDRAGRVSVPGKDLSRFEAREGDLLLARAIGSEQYLGKASVMQRVPQRILFDSHVMRLRPNPERTRGSFLWHLFQTSGGRRLLLKHGGRTAVQFNINTSQVADVRIPLPPFAHQERFLSLAARARTLQFKQTIAGATTDMLFDSVAHLAFRGELSGA